MTFAPHTIRTRLLFSFPFVAPALSSTMFYHVVRTVCVHMLTNDLKQHYSVFYFSGGLESDDPLGVFVFINRWISAQ
jgi:hypothetical protein